MVVTFQNLGGAGEAGAAIARSGLQLSLVETMDNGAIVPMDDWRNLGLDRDAAALLFLQSGNPESLITEKPWRSVGHQRPRR